MLETSKMTCIISTKKYIPPKSILRRLDRKAAYIEKLLPTINDQLRQVYIVIHKVREPFIGKRYRTFEIEIHINLPHKVIASHSESKSIITGIDACFRKLTAEVKKYKTLHFSTQSKYPHKKICERPQV